MLRAPICGRRPWSKHWPVSAENIGQNIGLHLQSEQCQNIGLNN